MRTSILKPLARKTLAKKIAEQLILFIQETLKEGEKLPCEKELGRMLEVGRSSLREALCSLEIMGIVETHSGAGTFVAHDTETFLQKPLVWGLLNRGKSLKELWEARTIIEMAILPFVIERITDQEIKHIETLVEQMETATPLDKEMIIEKDIQFHMLLAKATKNGVLHEAMKIIQYILQKDQIHGLETRPQIRKAASIHRAILEGLRRRDLVVTQQAMQGHLDRMSVFFIKSARRKRRKQ